MRFLLGLALGILVGVVVAALLSPRPEEEEAEASTKPGEEGARWEL